MTDVVLQSSSRFPVGTSVAVYPAANWSAVQKPPAGAPLGSATETQTVAADGSLTFTTLTDGGDYYAYASVSGEHRYVHFFGNRSVVTGSRGGNAALASLLTTLEARGLIVDDTS